MKLIILFPKTTSYLFNGYARGYLRKSTLYAQPWDVNARGKPKEGRRRVPLRVTPTLPFFHRDEKRDRCKSQNVIHPGLFKKSFLWTSISVIADACARARGLRCILHELAWSFTPWLLYIRVPLATTACRVNETVGRSVGSQNPTRRRLLFIRDFTLK